MRSGREHCGSQVAVGRGRRGGRGGRGGEDEEEEAEEEEAGGRRQEEKATDIKSNNPHLAGGEKTYVLNGSSIEVPIIYNQFVLLQLPSLIARGFAENWSGT